ncbi:MAG: ABC transporter ATP-binding protein [Bacteroidia bacterium]|nr:ABC transporter ATP-binding protein [Bacteroidia bacterium]
MKSLKYLNKFIWKYKYRFLLGVLFVAISNIFGVLPAQVIRIAIDLVNDTIEIYKLYNGFELQSELLSTFNLVLLFFGAAVLGLALARGIFLFMMRQTMIVMSRLIEYDLKNEIYDKLQNLSTAFYKKSNTGDLMARASEDVSRVRMYLGPALMYTVNVAVLFVLVITTMISVNAKLTFYVLIPLPILSIAIYFVTSIINEKSEKIQRQLSILSTFAQETFSGIRILKAYVKEENSINRFDAECIKYKDRSLELARVQSLFFPLMIVLIGLSTLLTVYVGGIEVINGNVTAGNIVEFVVYVNMLTWPVSAIGWVTSLVQRAAASQERINQILMVTPELTNSTTTKRDDIQGAITFNNVSFTYPETGIVALNNVSFKVNAGQSLAIIGRTGCGKSTIANLITRMFDVADGELLIDGKSIKKIDLNYYREQVGYVPQDVFLFSDTISNNIGFGINADVGIKTLVEAAKDAGIHQDIIAFRNGYETRIGERGITLSGGQKQRISIARATVKSPKILIFDDCLSAVDTKTEELILNSLKRIMQDRTTIIIGHRISSVRHAEKIIVLDKGAIIEEGDHESLIKDGGVYYKLYKLQLLEQELAT